MLEGFQGEETYIKERDLEREVKKWCVCINTMYMVFAWVWLNMPLLWFVSEQCAATGA